MSKEDGDIWMGCKGLTENGLPNNRPHLENNHSRNGRSALS